MKKQIWILTQIEVTKDMYMDIDSNSVVYSDETSAIEAMNARVDGMLEHAEMTGDSEINLDWNDKTGAQLSSEESIWTFKIEKHSIH